MNAENIQQDINLIFLPIGTSESKEPHQIYMDTEASHSFITNMMIRFVCSSMAMMYLVAAMFPITYAIFGYPPPELWILPLELQ